MSEQKHNVSINFDIKTTDGEQFMDAAINYYNMGYKALVDVETALGGAVVQLVELGKQAASEAGG